MQEQWELSIIEVKTRLKIKLIMQVLSLQKSIIAMVDMIHCKTMERLQVILITIMEPLLILLMLIVELLEATLIIAME